MRIILTLLIFFLAGSCAFSYSDLGVLNNQKTFSYFFMSPTDFSSISSGIVFHQRQNDRLAFEASGTAYKSPYLFTKNVTKIRLDSQYKLIEFGMLSLIGIAGPAIYYAPSVGAGLAVDVGGILAIKPLSGFGAGLAVNALIFKDGMEFNAEPTINLALGFVRNAEVYAGMRVEGSVVGFANDGSQGGKFNFYANAGLRVGL